MSETQLLQPVDYLQARRPWLALYGVRLRPRSNQLESEHLGPYDLGRAACTIRQWRVLTEHPKLWQQACVEALRPCKLESDLKTLLLRSYRGSWRRMFLEHPHLRFDGVYVSRNTYVRQGVVEWTRSRCVHLVCYYRYYRFFPDGTFLYRTSPNVISKVAKSMRLEQTSSKPEPDVHRGLYIIKGAAAYCVIVYPNSRQTEIRSKLQLQSTHVGAHNRLRIDSIHSFDRELGTSTDISAPNPEAEPDNPGLERRDHRRGLAPLVFVTWEAVNTTPLNLPPSEMDFYVA